MKSTIRLLFIFLLAQKVFSFDLNEKNEETIPKEIAVEVGVDCGKESNTLDFIIKMKNIGKNAIYLSDSFLGLSERVSDSFGIIEDPLGKKTNIPYGGIIREKKHNSQFNYSFKEGNELFIRHPISKFYQINLINDYEITYNIEFLSASKNLIFVGYAKTIIRLSDCEKGNGYLIQYKKTNPIGFFVDPTHLGII